MKPLQPFYHPPQPGPSGQQVVYVRPARRATTRVFRWWMLLVPLVLLFVMWLSQEIEPAMTFAEAAKACGISEREKLAQLATLGVLICAGLAVLRVLRPPPGR